MNGALNLGKTQKQSDKSRDVLQTKIRRRPMIYLLLRPSDDGGWFGQRTEMRAQIHAEFGLNFRQGEQVITALNARITIGTVVGIVAECCVAGIALGNVANHICVMLVSTLPGPGKSSAAWVAAPAAEGFIRNTTYASVFKVAVAVTKLECINIDAALAIIRINHHEIVPELTVVATIVHLQSLGGIEHIVADVKPTGTIIVVNTL